ncbi:hypothetical protein DUI87_25379 [Hirundo rustica rustica]|uniref:Uncharacterized protein n=1 Tax=Hirundo rustica rustica TaxID=333673 RepID=A0A3M0J9Q2_HIRRU|nr:hypothetical protein DUI87_25379 [Hirundo rustica rustica]
MVGVIFHVYLLLMAALTINQPAEKNGVSPEDDQEIVQRMKEREVFLEQHQRRLEQEIADLQARQEPVAWSLWELERKMDWQTCIGLALLVPVVLVVWMQHRNERRWEHRDQENEPGFLGESQQRSGLPDQALGAAQGHLHLHGENRRMSPIPRRGSC